MQATTSAKCSAAAPSSAVDVLMRVPDSTTTECGATSSSYFLSLFIGACEEEEKLAAASVDQRNEVRREKRTKLIDTSSTETLERDFYAWLKGELTMMSSSPLPKAEVVDEEEERGGETHHFSPHYHRQQQQQPTKATHIPSETQQVNPHPPSSIVTAHTWAPHVTDSLICHGNYSSSYHNYTIAENRLNFLLLSDGESSSSASTSSTLSASSLSSSPSSFSSGSSALPTRNDFFENTAKSRVYGAHSPVGTSTAHNGKLLAAASKDSAVSDEQPHPQQQSSIPQASTTIRSSGTNQLGRTYSPGLPLSISERQEIVKLYEQGWKICDISKKLCVTHSCVSKILNRFRTTGSVRPKDAKEGRKESPLVAAIKDYRLRLGIVRQFEIREQLIRDGICRRENVPSRSSINQ